jgi:hypothetical protein
MTRYRVLVCVLALLRPAYSLAQDGEVEASDYSDYFGDSPKNAREGPHSLGEARRQGRAYRLGQAGSVYRKPPREVHTVQEGDTLWDISDHYFGDPWHWPELWSYNPEITNPHWIYPLDQVRLSADALGQDQAVASAQQGASAAPKATAANFQEPHHGLPTDLAPRVTVPRSLMGGDTVFLRDQGYLDDDEIKASGQLVAGGAENMLLSNSDVVYVHFKPGQPVQPGQEYTAYRAIYKWEREPKEKGQLVRIQGTLLIRSFDAKKSMARAIITEAVDPIERGMLVTLMDRRFDLVPAKPNAQNVVAHIIASVAPRTLLSYANVVFLDVGVGHGILPGNRFFVIRRGDNWLDVLSRPPDQMGNIVPIPHYNKDDLPKEVVAELRVVKVRRHITVAVITRSDTDVTHGDTAEMRIGF